MPDVTITSETTAGIAYNATAAQVEAALEGLTLIGAGNVAVTGAAPNWDVEFTGTLAAQDILPMTADGSGLTSPTPVVNVTVLQAGTASPATNERQRLARSVITTGGTFTVTYYTLAGKRLEHRQAMQWIRSVLLADPSIQATCGPRVYADALVNKASKPPFSIEIFHVSNVDMRNTQGIRQYTDNLIGVAVVTPETQPGRITDLLAQRLSELFDAWDNQVVTEDGVNVADLLTCRRAGQYAKPEKDTALGDWQHLGVVVEIALKQRA